jgi:hypothetical protein
MPALRAFLLLALALAVPRGAAAEARRRPGPGRGPPGLSPASFAGTWTSTVNNVKLDPPILGVAMLDRCDFTTTFKSTGSYNEVGTCYIGPVPIKATSTGSWKLAGSKLTRSNCKSPETASPPCGVFTLGKYDAARRSVTASSGALAAPITLKRATAAGRR